MWFVGLLVLAYTGVALLLWSQQDRLIYPAPRTIGPSTGGFEAVTYRTQDGLDISAGYRPAEAGMPTIAYFHGNGADWVSSVVATDRLVPAGYGVLAAEYRGYRGNPGSPSEAGLYHDGRAALGFLAEQGVAAEDMILIGNSIGSGVATQLASEHAPKALILISPFASMRQLVGEKVRWLPTGLLLRSRYENAEKIARVHAPVLILHGDADTLIPATHARQLAALREDAQLVIFEGKGHDLAWHDEAEEAVLDFMETLETGGAAQ